MNLTLITQAIIELLQGDNGSGWLAAAIAFVGLTLILLFVLAIRSRNARKANFELHTQSEKDQQTIYFQEESYQQLSEQSGTQISHLNSRVAELEPLSTKLSSELAGSQAEVRQLGERLSHQLFQTQEQEKAKQLVEHELNQLKVESSQIQARMLAEQKAMQEKLQLLQENKQQLGQEFENLANKIFQEKQQSFNQNSKSLLESSISPLKSQLESFRKRVDDVYSHEAKERHLLKGEIEKLRAESLRISEDATNLTHALKADNKTQGNWGELTLKRALEICGLTEPNEFETQLSFETDERKRQIPDVIVHLPGSKDIIIDSKVSLVSYSQYFETEDEQEREQALKQHLQSVKQHIKDLSGKSYQNLPGLNTLDYVMMYIPIEGASSMALQSDRALWEEAYSKNIVLVSPTNLLAILRSVETIWRHEKQNKNAEKIAAEAGKLHDQFVLFAESLADVGRQIDRAHAAYEKANERLSSGRGNVIRRIENLEKLGAKTQRKIPDALLDKADGDATEVERSLLDKPAVQSDLIEES